MPDKDETINDEGIPSSPDDNADDLIPTTSDEMVPSAETLTTDEARVPTVDDPVSEEGSQTDQQEKAGEEHETKPSKADERFDKSERFQEMNARIKEYDTAIKTLTAQVQQLSPKESGEPSALSKLADMDDEEIRDQLDEKPKEFLMELINATRADTISRIEGMSQAKTVESAIDRTFDDYSKENETFAGMWQSGKIKRYMDEHPGHNAMSAHQVLTRESREKALIEKITKETEARLTKQFRAKGHAKTLSSGPSGAASRGGDEIAPELKDTKKFGGVVSVITQRLKDRRQAMMGSSP